MRIDAHVHYTPPSMVEDLRQFAEQEPYWSLLVTPQSPNHIHQGWATAERMIEDMDKAGIDKVVLLSEYRLKHESCIARNNQALEIIRRWPERVIAFACIQPKAGQQAIDELKRCVAGGMRGVGELNPYGQAYTLDDADFLRIAQVCIENNLPMNLHVSEEVGHYYLGKSTTPLLHYYRLACRYPELKLILSHWGGGLLFYELMPEVRRQLKNVWYDTATSPLLYPTAKIFHVALQCLDHRKILYGSDYPLLLYPRKQREPDFRPFIAEIEALGLGSEVYDDIMGNNAARLFGLIADEPPVPIVQKQRPSRVTVDISVVEGVQIHSFMAVSAVAEAWPATRPVFDRFDIPWKDSAVPFWEPIIQAAAARGWGPQDQQRLLDELNTAIGRS